MNKNPFENFGLDDMMKLWGDNPFTKSILQNDFAKNFTRGDTPDFDLSTIMESQRKNLDTITALNKKTGENMSRLVEKQSGLMAEAFETMKNYAGNAADIGENNVEKKVEEAQGVFQKAMENMTELGQFGKDASEDMYDIVADRMKESMGELEGLMKKFKA